MKLDVLVVAAHPDDAEISLGGTLLRMVRAGRRVGIVDLTRGELGTRGERADRDAETAAASELLGLSVRLNLGLPDGRVIADVAARESLAACIREHAPDVLLCHHTEDLHPDHAAAGKLGREAWYLSGLDRLAQRAGGAGAHRPARILHFMGHLAFEPTFVVDISAVWEDKLELVRAYATQLVPAHAGDAGAHLLFGADILERMRTKARYFGEQIGVAFGEPLLHRGPLPLEDPILRNLLT
ncbi:MAG: bacillithiol biosynthesis deacetylase BshB1 [Planctomycetota bacterium]